MWQEILTVLATAVVVPLFRDKLKKWGAEKVARAILEDASNDITDPAQALREAWVLANDPHIRAAGERLAVEQQNGKLRIASATAIGKANGQGIDATIVPRDGSETFKPGWE
jgi:hypothetical protein